MNEENVFDFYTRDPSWRRNLPLKRARRKIFYLAERRSTARSMTNQTGRFMWGAFEESSQLWNMLYVAPKSPSSFGLLFRERRSCSFSGSWRKKAVVFCIYLWFCAAFLRSILEGEEEGRSAVSYCIGLDRSDVCARQNGFHVTRGDVSIQNEHLETVLCFTVYVHLANKRWFQNLNHLCFWFGSTATTQSYFLSCV